jgi:predicted RND superfamily exporter protein
MERLFRWSARHPVLSLLGAALLCLVLGPGVLKLRVDASLEHLLSPEDPRLVELNEVRENFGNRPLLAILASSPRLFSPEVLEQLRERDEAFAAVEGVVESSSLFRTAVPVAKNGLLSREAPLARIPREPGALAAVREAILANNLLRGQLLNDRGDAMVMLYFLPPERAGRTDHAAIVASFEQIVAHPADGITLTLIGAPMVKTQLQDHIFWDLTRLNPIALLVVGLVILLFYRSRLAVLVPLLTGGLSALATLGFMGYAGFEISVFLSTIVILVLVLGCAEDLHLLSEYFDEIGRGTPRIEAIARSGKSNGTALLLASGTTILGFASLLFTEIEGMRHFAISCSIGLSVNFLITVLVLPAVLALAPTPGRGKAGEPVFFRRLGLVLTKLHHRRRGAMAAVCVALLGLSLAGISRLETDTDYLRFFSDRSPTVQAYDRFREAFGGAAHLTVTYETGERHGVVRPEHLANLRELTDFLEGEGAAVMGLTHLVEEYGKVSREVRSPADRPGPGGEGAFLLEKLPRETLRPFVDYDGSRAAIRVRCDAPTSSQVLRFEKRILDHAARTFGEKVVVRVTGEPVLTAHLCELVTDRLVSNLAILAAVVAGIIALIVRSLRQGLIALVPNLFPIVLTFGVMGWLGIPLSTATFPVANIALGIAVDDTIHFLLRYQALRRTGQGIDRALRGTIRAELRPILATSVVIGCGYLVMMLSPLRANAEAGLLFAIAIFSALLADLVLTPVLLRWLARRGGDGVGRECPRHPK